MIQNSSTLSYLTFEEIEVKASRDWWGAVDVVGGLAVELININGQMVLIDIDGTACASRRGISLGGYEERS